MKSQLQPLFEKYNALNERERIMILALSVVANFIVFLGQHIEKYMKTIK